MKHTSTWKKVELEIARLFGGERRGADYRDKFEGGGKSDIILPGYSIEVKHSKRPCYSLMQDAVTQAETNREAPDDIPLAVIHKEGQRYDDSLVVMRLEEFRKFFVSEVQE